MTYRYKHLTYERRLELKAQAVLMGMWYIWKHHTFIPDGSLEIISHNNRGRICADTLEHVSFEESVDRMHAHEEWENTLWEGCVL